jgi:glycosyltransferase involved in cell wall biosynthesis
LNVRRLHGPRRVRYGRDEAVVICLLRDAEPYIRCFIDHYLRLGVRHIVLLDNGSTDETVAIAARHPQVTVFRTTLPFKGNNRSMRRYLIRRFAGRGKWVLVVDVDELFDYPSSNRVPLSSLLRYLRARSYTTMAAYQLDMFSERPLTQEDAGGGGLREAFPFYDVSAVRKLGYFEKDDYRGDHFVRHNRLTNPEVKRYVGGIRAQMFGLHGCYLIKHPVMRMDGTLRYSHQHFADHATVADVTGVLYHYKFAPGFAARVRSAVGSGAYAGDSYEYRHYLRALEADPALCLKTETARRLGSVDELVDQGFLQVTPQYREWVEREAGGRS